jgi:splicing factor 3B subunit 1
VDTTVELANKVGPSEIINRVVDDLKDENEQYRKMVMETIEKVKIKLIKCLYTLLLGATLVETQ